MPTYGDYDPHLTKVIQRLARTEGAVSFSTHAQEEMDDDGFNHLDVLAGLRRGKAFGPEPRNGDLAANVIHRGHEIRVVVGGLAAAAGDWSRLARIRVVTVMRQK